MTATPRPGHEIRRNPDGSLDEIVGWAFVHLEQMDTGHWWLGIDTEDGRLIHVNFHARGKITARAEYEGASDLWRRQFEAAEAEAVAEQLKRKNAEALLLEAAEAELSDHAKRAEAFNALLKNRNDEHDRAEVAEARLGALVAAVREVDGALLDCAPILCAGCIATRHHATAAARCDAIPSCESRARSHERARDIVRAALARAGTD